MFKRLMRVHVFVAGLVAVLVASVLTPADALTNTPANGLQNCNPSSATITNACLTGALHDYNAARAKEHLGRLILPSNFRKLTVLQQLLVLTNLDRRARGLAPFIGLNSTLNQYAASGAAGRRDPSFPRWTRMGGANWSSAVNSLWTEFLWMYDDGVGSPNISCTRTSTTWCWAHRHNILAAYGSPRVMGAGSASHGDATLYLGSDSHDTTFTFRWSSEAKYFPGGRLP